MLFQVVHSAGITTYLLFSLIFFFFSYIPRTNPGARWWAAASCCAAVARMLVFLLPDLTGDQYAIYCYSAAVILEKSFLVIGATRFFRPRIPTRWVVISAVILELWIPLAWLLDVPMWLYAIPFSLFNVATLLLLAWLFYRKRRSVMRRLMTVAALICSLLALHWSTFPTVFFLPGWRVEGFVVGTVLVLALYMILLTGVFLLFRQRLLNAEAKALKLAYQDPLTGLNNKHYLTSLFDKVLQFAMRPHHLLAVLFIDLDNFKPINDQAGHKTGDQVLKEVAQRLKSHTRSTDISVRIGGDEFIVIATQLENEQQAADIAAKLVGCLTAEISIGRKSYCVGASIGVSIYPIHGTDLSALIEAADEAMYSVKRNGRNGFAVYRGCKDSAAEDGTVAPG